MGNDWGYSGSSYLINGGKGDDTITVTQNLTNSTFEFSKGDGNDVISSWSSSTATTRATNTLKFTDVKFEDMTFGVDKATQGLRIQYTENDSVVIKGWYSLVNGQRIDKIVDMTGTEYSIVNDAPDYDKLFLTDGDDTLTVSQSNLQVYCYEGNDTISVNASNNTIYGGDGADTITINNYLNNNTIYGGDGADTITVNVNCNNTTIYGGDGDDKINIGTTWHNDVSNNTTNGGKGDDTITVNQNLTNSTFEFSKGDGNDVISSWSSSTATSRATNTLKFTDVKFEDMGFSAVGNHLKISYTENDSFTITNWISSADGKRINQIVDSTGAMGLIAKSGDDIGVGVGDNTYSTALSSNLKFYDPFTTDNDTLKINNTNAVSIHIAANFKADGTLDDNGVRVMSGSNYTAWCDDTTSVDGGIQIVGEFGSVENIESQDGYTVTASELSQLKSDVTSWLTAHTDYADVASAIANKANDTSVAELVAIFDDFNTQAWGS